MLLRPLKRPQVLLAIQIVLSAANTRADQWSNAGAVWRAKMAQRDQAMASEPARSPSGEEKAYVAQVASRKNL